MSASVELPCTVHEAERCWYDTTQWGAWVEGLETVDRVDGIYPGAGAEVSWHSGPAGRGVVRERVIEHQTLEGQTVEVQDDSIVGRQRVSFVPSGEAEVHVLLELDYSLRRPTLFTPLLDRLFIRRAIAASLENTLRRFGQTIVARR